MRELQFCNGVVAQQPSTQDRFEVLDRGYVMQFLEFGPLHPMPPCLPCPPVRLIGILRSRTNGPALSTGVGRTILSRESLDPCSRCSSHSGAPTVALPIPGARRSR